MLLVCFQNRVSLTFALAASGPQFSYFCLQSSWDGKCASPCPAEFFLTLIEFLHKTFFFFLVILGIESRAKQALYQLNYIHGPQHTLILNKILGAVGGIP
jgi:hypothetical protein